MKARAIASATICFLVVPVVAATNPFAGKTSGDFYINPVNFKQYEVSISSADGKVKENLKDMQAVPSAYWIDVKSKIREKGTADDFRSLEGILKDAASKPQPQLCVFMWYDLPNRDCKALASNGEICCNKNSDGTCNYALGGECKEGLREYKEEYVEPFIEVLREYQDRVPIVVVVEPDSLPNLATNVAHPHCGSSATQTAYKEGIKYSLHQLTTRAVSVTVYLDAAHGGWLGWENSMEQFMKVLKSMDVPKIRGFATNVANYQPLGIQCPWCPDQGFRNGYCLNGQHKSDPCCADPCGLASQYNFGNNELNYAAGLVAAADRMLGMDAHVIIDTGRNGVVDHRSLCSNWCNPRNSGAGVKSTADVANSTVVDAYFWLKTPGESDGCTEMLPEGGKCSRFDHMCGSTDSLGSRVGEPRSPEAGHWFDYQVKQLAENANFNAPPTEASIGSCSVHGGRDGSNTGGNAGSAHSGANAGGGSSSASGGAANAGGANAGGANAGGGRDAGGGNAGAGGGAGGNSGVCADAYGQCGGNNWNGPKCCESGCKCRHEGEWYSQCEPPAGSHMCSSSTDTMVLADGTARSTLDKFGEVASANLAFGVASISFVLGVSAAVVRLWFWQPCRSPQSKDLGQFQRSAFLSTEELGLLDASQQGV